MSIAIIKFPGTQCEEESLRACRKFDNDSRIVYHTDLEEKYDAYFIPGGWSYGDHLRAGIIAANTECMGIIKKEAQKGKKILGICNGFQILCESQILSGALLRNESLKFVCKFVHIKIEENCSFLNKINKQVLKIPIAHGEGRFVTDNLEELEKNKIIVATYQNENPNGSMNSIAGICNKKGNVVGMMPHPERAVDLVLGSKDGLKIIECFAKY
ncbi:MAG: phosphoribosylformylglycinamidine synthase subunit PurQ [Candidatus Micrarchaeota archaeon]|nr:phosphoribosylformylglycinamidine synthase subunit PurQ [Candidatus Micrarchaeota archaeon]